MRCAIVVAAFMMSGCLSTSTRDPSHPKRLTQYSPGDGLVIVGVDSSTTAVSVSSVAVELENIDLRYRVKYRTGGRGILVEPGRYSIRRIELGGRYASVNIGPFDVVSGRIVVLPRLVVFAEGEKLLLRPDPTTTSAHELFFQTYAKSAWVDRPWRAVSVPAEVGYALWRIPPKPTWHRFRSSGGYGYRTHYSSSRSGGRSSPSAGRRSPR